MRRRQRCGSHSRTCGIAGATMGATSITHWCIYLYRGRNVSQDKQRVINTFIRCHLRIYRGEQRGIESFKAANDTNNTDGDATALNGANAPHAIKQYKVTKGSSHLSFGGRQAGFEASKIAQRCCTNVCLEIILQIPTWQSIVRRGFRRRRRKRSGASGQKFKSHTC